MLATARIGPSVNEVRLTIRCLLPEGHPTLKAVVAELHVSTRSLQRQLACAGLTYTELVRDVRQERACQLLQQSEISIKQVALRTGFANSSGFSRAFHAWTGLSPRDYRRNPDLARYERNDQASPVVASVPASAGELTDIRESGLCTANNEGND